jgi:bifunctional UDP-N-acetylglucosamine pyrophosphorylase / glucosamine-1-phosphate N-acetyltransferase
MSLSVIILAGGTGSRMKSAKPKVLHSLANKPLVEHVINTVSTLGAEEVFVVHGHMGQDVRDAMSHCDHLKWVEQAERLGTGHAVQQVLPYLNTDNKILILYGDVPLIKVGTLEQLIQSTSSNQVGLLTAEVHNPKGLGRIVRDQYRQVYSIVEEKDASELERQITEINTGIYCVPGKHLATWLPKLDKKNAQGEYYLTDIVAFARQDKVAINISQPGEVEEIYGANTRAELAKLESIYQVWQTHALMDQGVTLMDPSRVDIRGTVTAERDCTLDVNVILEGTVHLSEGCFIGHNVHLKNVTVGKGVCVEPNAVVENTSLK